MLRVLVDARKVLHGGIGVYVQNLVAGVCESKEKTGVSLALLGKREELEQFAWFSEVQVFEEAARPYSYDEMMRMGKRIRQICSTEDFHLFHEPHFTLPFGVPVPSIVTVHDLIHMQQPEKYYYPFVSRGLIRSALRRAQRVVAVSEATRRDLLALCDRKPGIANKVSVLPNALDPYYLDTQSAPSFVKDKFGIDGSYLLCVASMNKPHKGVRDLLAAFRAFQSASSETSKERRFQLVFAGQGTGGHIAPAPGTGPAANQIRFLGEVSREELLHLYDQALALVVPSRAEGFCLPVIEAQARGIPILARPVPAILELLTERDLVAENFSIEALTDLLCSWSWMFDNHRERMEQQPPDRKHLQRFERREIGRAYASLYRELTSASAERPDPRDEQKVFDAVEALPADQAGNVL